MTTDYYYVKNITPYVPLKHDWIISTIIYTVLLTIVLGVTYSIVKVLSVIYATVW